MKTVYKICSKNITYGFISFLEKGNVLRYNIEEITKPTKEDYWIFAFISYEDAYKYAEQMTSYFCILKCEAPDNSILARYCSFRWDEDESFWKNFHLNESSFYIMDTPKGTIVCPWIKPTEIVFNTCK
jgi:hypothetical protein